MAEVILKKEPVGEIANINRIVEGKEEISEFNLEKEALEGDKEVEMIATKNRERFAIKKTYSLEASIIFQRFHLRSLLEEILPYFDGF